MKIQKFVVIATAFLLNLAGLSSAYAVSRFVATTGSDTGDCSNVNAPCQTIAFAITQSGVGDDIQIAAGQYNENNFFIAAGAELSFNGAGQGTDPSSATIIDGGTAALIFFNNSDNVTFSNLTLQNGDGALFNNGNFLVIDNLLITANNTGTVAVFNNGNNFSITNTNILNNLGHGGMFNNGNDGQMDQVNIVGNQSSGDGGGIFNNGNNLSLNSVAIDNNQTDAFGGGMFNNGNNVTATSLSISGNQALNSGDGGGLFNNGDDFSFTDCNINNNHSGANGGAIFNNGANTTFNRCSISGNTIMGVLGSGGALFNNGDDSSFLNTTISNNSAVDDGGAIFSNTSTDTPLVNVTIAGNSDSAAGDGIFNNDITGAILLKNTIMANGANGGNCDGPGTFLSLGHNISDDNSCPLGGTGDLPNTNSDLGPLQDNGGNTLTQALLVGSQAINGVPIADCNDINDNPITVDQRNQPRPIGGACDMGAFEFSAGTFQFDMANYIVNEDAGFATITVIRAGGFDGDGD